MASEEGTRETDIEKELSLELANSCSTTDVRAEDTSSYQSIYSNRCDDSLHQRTPSPTHGYSSYTPIYSTPTPSTSNDHSTRSTGYSSYKSNYSHKAYSNRPYTRIYTSNYGISNTTQLFKRPRASDSLSTVRNSGGEMTKEGCELEEIAENREPQKQIHTTGPVWSWEDQLLKTKEKKLEGNKKSQTSLWRPGSSRHVNEGNDAYRPFTHITRVLHIDDAVDVFLTNRIRPKPVTAFSCIGWRSLPPDHPCVNLEVLWFGAKCRDAEDTRSNWYGNVEFAADANILLKQWKYWFLVEMMTTPTHTATRILVTNKDYSSVLPPYDRSIAGGPWRVTPEGQMALTKCSRYQFRGKNIHDHVLEFMIEAQPQDERAILAAAEISFLNHEEAKYGHISHVCSRYQKEGRPCPYPFSASQASRHFFRRMKRRSVSWDTLLVKLTPAAQKELEWFKEDERRTALQYQRRGQ